MSAGWLFEIGAEELPYKTCQSLLAQLRGKGTAESPGLVYETLAAERLLGDGDGADPAGFAETRLKVMVAPRRVAVVVTDLPREQTAETSRFRGPRVDVAFGPDGAPTKAGAGFARSKGLTPERLERETSDGNEFVVAVIKAEQRPTQLVLPDVCRRLITALQIPRGMRWGARPAGADDYLRFSRPVRWLTCVFAGQPVPFGFYDLRAGDVTQGHRVLGQPLIVDHASHYERHLREQHVVVDQDERRRLIVEGLDTAAAKLGGRWSDPAGVLEENIYLAEWPSVHAGAFDARHLRLPREVLVTAMQAHQRYWPVEDASGRLLPAFLYVSNADPAAAALITHGNERVLEGRLDDAEFSYDRDLAEGLEAMASRLSEVVFHAKLGSLADKSARLASLAQGLVGWVGGPDDRDAVAAAANLGLTAPVTGELPAAVIAARFAKADLVSQVVIEFPSLQGRVGGVYAGKAGAAPAVAQAITEHYRPLSAVAPIPGTLAGGLVAIAEKIDNIAGAWLAAEKPSGSRDPYGLRRAAMGIVRIALENDLHIVPRELTDLAFAAYTEQGKVEPEGHPRAEIAAFIWERLEGLLLDEGLPFPLVEAALGAAAPSGGSAVPPAGSAASPPADAAVDAAVGTASPAADAPTPSPADLPRVAALARAFARLEAEPFFNDVVVAYTRPAALAAKAAAEPGGVPAQPDPALFADESEHALAAALAEVRGPLFTALAGGDVEAALLAAATLRAPIDCYFDDVLVMDKDPAVRVNRLAQLTQITTLLGSLGDFSRLPVQQG
jgi:glycyl-tRNA synthetase beta chain